MTEIQADLIEGVIREVLDSLDLPAEVLQRALDRTADALRRAADEGDHYDPIVSDHGGYQRAVSYQR